MKRDDAISIAREALQREGFSFLPTPSFAELISADEYNKHLTATRVSGARWIVNFPSKNANDIRSEASISVDDTTGVAAEGQTV